MAKAKAEIRSVQFNVEVPLMKDHLLWGGVDTTELVRKFGTPLYVMDAGTIRKNWHDIHDAMIRRHKKTTICYAYKANSHLAICKLLSNLGAGAEVASGGELYAALKVGVSSNRIVFDGPNKSVSELETAIKSGVMINADSLTEIKRIQLTAKNLSIKARIGIRVNLDIRVETHPHLSTAMKQHKFGVWKDALFEVCEFASRQDMIELIGLHSHLGSEIRDVRPFGEACGALLDLSNELSDKLQIEIGVLNLGGGLGIAYTGTETVPSVDQFAEMIATRLQQKMAERASEPTLILELGRYLVASAGILLAKVGVVKRTAFANWALVDSGMNHLIRPALYNAYHRIVVANKMNSDGEENYSVGGPCCESGDVMGNTRTLPFLEEGDILAIMDAGAYGFTMSSNYNSYPRPLVVLVNEGEANIIRDRENYEDVFRLERIPNFLV